MPVKRFRLLHASEAATQAVPQYISLTYGDLFKIQRVANPFPLRPVSFSSLTSYLECPGCALEQQRKRRPKEPKHFTNLSQGSLFGGKEPDPRLVGTLLHAIINLLHDPQSPIEEEQQSLLLTDPDVLTRFLRHDLLSALRLDGKLKLAIFLDALSTFEETFTTGLIEPILRYQQELRRTGSTVFAASERFQFKLLSTGSTFAGHRDWGGYVGLVGEFDQIRLHRDGEVRTRPAIIEFKKSLGKKRSWDKLSDLLGTQMPAAVDSTTSNDLLEPGLAHALQLMIYWMAFQTRWDISEQIMAVKGQIDNLSMPLQQELDLILYDLHTGCQYQLIPNDLPAALLALTNCIFHLNWAMKSGYAVQSSEHDCGKTQLLTEVPRPLVQVGYDTLSAEKCYALARESFERFSTTISWHKLPAE